MEYEVIEINQSSEYFSTVKVDDVIKHFVDMYCIDPDDQESVDEMKNRFKPTQEGWFMSDDENESIYVIRKIS